MAITKITTPELFNLQSNNTEGTQLPVMTTTQREAMTGMSNGELIFNSTTDSVEYYDLGAPAWYKIDYEPLYPTSLKMYLDASNTTSYPGTGTTWFDLTSNANNGTLNSPSWNPLGYFNFNGTNDIITTPSGFYGFPVQTWSLWVKPDVLERGDLMQTYPSGAIPTGAMYIEIAGTSGVVEAGVRNNSASTSSVTSTSALTVGQWSLVTVTSDGTYIKIYINNGTPVSNSAAVSSVGANNQSLVIGYEPRNNRLWFDGKMSKVRVYDVALNQAEITALHNEGS